MIDIRTESVRPLNQARKIVAGLRGGRRVNIATIYRWAAEGCRGRKLETIQIGGTRCTSLEALQRFFDSLTEAGPGPDDRDAGRGVGRRPSTARTRRQTEAVDRELDALGL